jgi:hypothetical protein
VLRSLTRLLGGRSEDGAQLALPLDPVAAAPPAPRTAEELLERLRALGLRRMARCRLTRNRTVMVSYRGAELRVHEGYLDAPAHVWRAIVVFAQGRTAAERRAARDVVLGWRVAPPAGSASARRERTHPEDERMAGTLAAWHRRLNAEHFGGALRELPIRVSRRMRSRLGHYTAATPGGDPPEIAISRRHIRRHGWDEAVHTLLHEMVHQWQDERGLAIDHGAAFRRRAREVGIAPSACRTVDRPHAAPEIVPRTVSRRAAREG